MKSNQPIDPRIRLAISQWPDDAPRGAVTTFREEHQISRKTFYKLRSIVRDEGQAAVLEPRSRRPKTSPTKISDQLSAQSLPCAPPWRLRGWTTARSACMTR